MLEKLFSMLKNKSNTTVLTPNNRLSIYLQKNLEVIYQESGVLHWPTPHCQPILTWAKNCLIECQAQYHTRAMHLLTPEQKLAVWQNIILAQSTTDTQNSTLAPHTQLAMDAWDMINLWQLKPEHWPPTDINTDVKQMHDWWQHARKLYAQEAYIDASQYYTTLRLHLEQHPTNIPACLKYDLILFAFDEVPPALTALLEALQGIGISITPMAYAYSDTPCYKTSATDINTEISQMVTWAVKTHERNPAARIACIIPDVAEHRVNITHHFAACFAEIVNTKENPPTLPINISGGEPLADASIIHQALTFLHFCLYRIPITAYSNLYRAACWQGNQRHALKRAQADSLFRQYWFETDISLIEFMRWQASNTNSLFDSEWCSLLECICERLATLTEPTASYLTWATLFLDILSTAKWPGEHTLSSTHFQQLEMWQQALTALTALDEVCPPCNAITALTRLQTICQQRLFQTQTDDAPIQVLGWLEAAGIPFDYVWMMGLDQNHFPQSAAPNPFLPYSIQHHYQTPHASAVREFAFAKTLLTRLQHSTKHQFIASFSTQDGDCQQTESPLIQHFSALDLDGMLPNNVILHADRLNQVSLESFIDDHGPALSQSKLKGGASILSDYSACYFRGFAKHRLHARTPAAFSQVFNPIRRGILCHQALEWFWQHVNNSQTLAAFSQDEFTSLCDQAVDQAIAMHIPIIFQHKIPHLIQCEKRCIANILDHWLMQEKQRQPFKVLHTEHRLNTTINDLTFTLRIDRIDELPDGSTLIIDYKTGRPTIAAWQDARLDDPQLPLYCISSELPVSGILFGILRADIQQFIGLTQHTIGLDKVIAMSESTQFGTWNSQVQAWQQNIRALTDEIKSGHATCNPKYAAQTCQRCEHMSLCRIQDKGASLDD